jgi:GTP cyclohydrolase IA
VKKLRAVDTKKIMQATRMLLEGIGEDPDRPGLKETPRRVAAMWQELTAGMGQRAEDIAKPIPLEDYDEIILMRDIPLVSMCEHHLVPFIGKAHVAYLPKKNRVTGLSKLARIVEMEARKLQVQERMTNAIADDIVRTLEPRGVMVVVEAEHLCMTIRGAHKPGVVTVTSVVRGVFRAKPATRAEALALIRGERRHG